MQGILPHHCPRPAHDCVATMRRSFTRPRPRGSAPAQKNKTNVTPGTQNLRPPGSLCSLSLRFSHSLSVCFPNAGHGRMHLPNTACAMFLGHSPCLLAPAGSRASDHLVPLGRAARRTSRGQASTRAIEEGMLTSIGTTKHAEGECQPCIFWCPVACVSRVGGRKGRQDGEPVDEGGEREAGRVEGGDAGGMCTTRENGGCGRGSFVGRGMGQGEGEGERGRGMVDAGWGMGKGEDGMMMMRKHHHDTDRITKTKKNNNKHKKKNTNNNNKKKKEKKANNTHIQQQPQQQQRQ